MCSVRRKEVDRLKLVPNESVATTCIEQCRGVVAISPT